MNRSLHVPRAGFNEVMWWWVCCVMIAISPVATASADGIRGQGFVFDANAGAGALHDDETAPAIRYGLGLGFALDRAATIALGVELAGFASWNRGVRRDRAAFLGTATVWLGESVSLKLGVGTPVGPAAIAEGLAAFGRVGYELRRWTRTALVVSLDVSGDTTAGPQVNALLGFEVFTHEQTMNFWHPK